VNINGGYFEIQDFLVRLENLVKGSDPARVAPRSVLVQSVSLATGSEGATGDSAAATPAGAASPDELQEHRPDRVPVGAVQRHVEHAGGHGRLGRAGEVRRPWRPNHR